MARTVDQVLEYIGNQGNIRHICVIAHSGHGRSTLTDCLVAAAGIIKLEATGQRYTERLSTSSPAAICSPTALSMHYELDGQQYLLNSIGWPGNVDFSMDSIAPSLRLADGAIVLVDAIEGVGVQTETLLRCALAQRIRPVLFINKIDRAIIELQMDPEELYQNLVRTNEHINDLINGNNASSAKDMQVIPQEGTVAFGSAWQGWAFSIQHFAQLYAVKFGVDEQVMVSRLWGDNFFDAKNKRWVKQQPNGGKLQRAFCQFCLGPIYQIFDAVLTEKHEKLDKILKSLRRQLTVEENELAPRRKLKVVMAKFLSASECLLRTAVKHLPSPTKAQQYRATILCGGEINERQVEERLPGIINCSPAAGVMMLVTKVIRDGEREFAFGRVFSGTIRKGEKVRVANLDSDLGSGDSMAINVQNCSFVMGGRLEVGSFSIPAGNLCCVAANSATCPYLTEAHMREAAVTTPDNSCSSFTPSITRWSWRWHPVCSASVRTAVVCVYSGLQFIDEKTSVSRHLPSEVAWEICRFFESH